MIISEMTEFENPAARIRRGYDQEIPYGPQSTASALSFVTHDIRNLLTVISLNAERLMMGGLNKGNDIGNRILKQVDQIEAICSAAGGPNISKRARPHVRPRRSKILISNMISDVIDCLPENNPPIKFQVICDDALEISICRPTMFRILYNLVSNAVTALEGTNSPKLKIVAMAWPDSFQIDIIDNGPGLPSSLRQSLETSQIDRTWQGGLGILVVKMLMDEQGGKFELVNSTKNGTHFRLTFESLLQY